MSATCTFSLQDPTFAFVNHTVLTFGRQVFASDPSPGVADELGHLPLVVYEGFVAIQAVAGGMARQFDAGFCAWNAEDKGLLWIGRCSLALETTVQRVLRGWRREHSARKG